MALDLDEAINQMRDKGIEIPSRLEADGKKYTWAGTPGKPKKKNAWAILHEWTSPKSNKNFIVGVYGHKDDFWKAVLDVLVPVLRVYCDGDADGNGSGKVSVRVD